MCLWRFVVLVKISQSCFYFVFSYFCQERKLVSNTYSPLSRPSNCPLNPSSSVLNPSNTPTSAPNHLRFSSCLLTPNMPNSFILPFPMEFAQESRGDTPSSLVLGAEVSWQRSSLYNQQLLSRKVKREVWTKPGALYMQERTTQLSIFRNLSITRVWQISPYHFRSFRRSASPPITSAIDHPFSAKNGTTTTQGLSFPIRSINHLKSPTLLTILYSFSQGKF